MTAASYQGVAFAAALLVSALPLTVSAADYPAAVQSAIAEISKNCSEFENGQTTLEDGAVRRLDLTGNGTEDWVIDSQYMSCSSAASMFCGGTGGCYVTFVVEDVITQTLNKGWERAKFGNLTPILLQVHGSNCGGTNLTPCVQAMVWDDGSGSFTTVGSQLD